MNTTAHSPIKELALQILRPLVRVLLRNGMTCQEFCELARQSYVESALSDFPESGKKITDARASALTGLNRKEIRRLRQQIAETKTGQNPVPAPRGERVVSGWQRDPDFLDADGKSALLPFNGSRSFSELVRRYSGDIPPRAMLEELKRVGVATEADQGIKLMKAGYIPSGDPGHLFGIVGKDVSALLNTVDHNLRAASDAELAPRLQRTVRYTRIPVSVLPEWQAFARAESEALLKRLNHWLAQQDGDVAGNPDQVEDPVTTGLSVFYFDDTSPNREESP